MRQTTMGRVRKGKKGGRQSGFLVTWDVDSADRTASGRVYRFVYGSSYRKGERVYRYPGFVERNGVRYLGQSVLFVPPSHLHEIDSFLTSVGVDHEASPAILG